MAKDVITVNGEEKVVREDTAKSYRGVIWALVSIGAFILIVAIVAMLFFGGSISRGVDSPAEIEKQAGR
jgi:hypothetical protein